MSVISIPGVFYVYDSTGKWVDFKYINTYTDTGQWVDLGTKVIYLMGGQGKWYKYDPTGKSLTNNT